VNELILAYFQGESETRLGIDGRLPLFLSTFTQVGALSRWLHQSSSRSWSEFHRSRQMAHSRTSQLLTMTPSVAQIFNSFVFRCKYLIMPPSVVDG
jgi:hypothetical protein